LSRSTSVMKNERIWRRCANHAGVWM
jgi:hypothetical protein